MRFYTFALTLLSIAPAFAGVEYSKVAEANSARIGQVVVRYIRLYASPCLEVEVLAPEENWKVVTQKSFCDLGGLNFTTDFSYAGFEDISVKQTGIHVILSTFPLPSTEEERRECTISIEQRSVGDLVCAKPMRNEFNGR
jgi:hypothetical protein